MGWTLFSELDAAVGWRTVPTGWDDEDLHIAAVVVVFARPREAHPGLLHGTSTAGGSARLAARGHVMYFLYGKYMTEELTCARWQETRQRWSGCGCSGAG